MRIVHLSDLHLRDNLPGMSDNPARLSRDMPKLLERAVDEIYDLSPDLFVVSGDLIDYPLDELDNPERQEQARKDLLLIGELLDEVERPTVLVFGNHDHPEVFRQVFEPLDSDIRVAGVRVLSFLDEEGPGHVPIRTGDQAQRFEKALAQRSAKPQIHVQHYVVWPERNDDYPHTYGEGAAMRDAILANGFVWMVLSGHYHPGIEPKQENGTWFATAPAFCEYPHAYWVYELRRNSFTWSQRELAGDND